MIPMSREAHTAMENRLDNKVNKLVDQIAREAAEVGIPLPPNMDDYKKSVKKFAYFEPLLDLMMERNPADYMTKQKSIVEYVDKVLAPAMGMKLVPGDAGRLKQAGLLSLIRQPQFTMLSSNFDLDRIYEIVELIRTQMSKDPDWQNHPFRDEWMSKPWGFGVHGFVGAPFTIGHGLTLSGKLDMPWSPQHKGEKQLLPMPEWAYVRAWEEIRPTIVAKGSYLNPAHLLIGSSASGGAATDFEQTVNVKNSDGAAGYPYVEEERARELTSTGARATKATVSKRELYEGVIPWLLADQPWSGPLWERLKQPTTMTTRGDAKVDINVLMFAVAMLQAGKPLAIMTLASRGIAITPTIQWMMEAVYGAPFLEATYVQDIQQYDVRTRRHEKKVISGIMADVTNGFSRATGTDVARWDLNKFTGEDAILASCWMSLYKPGKVPILVGAASRPALWSAELIEKMKREIPIGESKVFNVDVPSTTGLTNHIEKVKVYHLEIDLRKFIAQTHQLVNGSGVRLAGYDFPTNVQMNRTNAEITSMGDQLVDDVPTYVLHTHGCIRSGSYNTTSSNSMLNDDLIIGTRIALLELGPKSKFVRRAAAQAGLPMPTKITGTVKDIMRLIRGDDAIVADNFRIFHADGEYSHEEICVLCMAMAGRYANVDKQVSGTWNEPRLEYASVSYHNTIPGGNTDPKRSTLRTMTREGGTAQADLTLMDESEQALDLGLVADTLAAKSRVAPQRGSTKPGSPMGSPTPGNEEMIGIIAAMDKFGLVYGLETKDQAKLENMIEAEARRYVKRESRKHGLSEDLAEELREEYLEAELHAFLVERFNQGNTYPGLPAKGRKGVKSAIESYDEKVSKLRRGDGQAYIKYG